MNTVIIDDHPLTRIVIRNLLDTGGITIAAEPDSLSPIHISEPTR